ncbi:hypothetical protein [Desulfobacca acetoxidans]|uniref:Uncharacterized protein n=1 Tax=Desulfobacca acetoxidans (strain ATCC 700848 / DSM 11109 / ASRB2) TaxID=880072 RepID=F2NF92_DESAR|nr:hypothetical protein [Desulfobacca acetoxidans]AEB08647.1 hypothetical protein Desac_0768 [Desulfobacca acetoxidans DSM 11109]HAY22834.1 hypothetical protein [Desulfobacterales bacterium]
MVAYRILQLIPATGWEVELSFDDGCKQIHPLIAMALIERVDDHGDWYREVVGLYPQADGSCFGTVYDDTRVSGLTYRQQGENTPS